MKLPRWLVIGMLTTSVLAVLVAAGWWWVTWPERTARDFFEAMVADRQEDEMNMLAPGLQPWFAARMEFRAGMLRRGAITEAQLEDERNASKFQLQPPDWWQLLTGRRTLRIAMENDLVRPKVYGLYIVQRGLVVDYESVVGEEHYSTEQILEAIGDIGRFLAEPQE